jgi:hypothetical protein
MSNLAKDWQKGTYTIRVKDNLVEIDTIRPIKKETSFGPCTLQKRYVGTARCASEDEFSLNMGIALALDRLSKELDKDKIEVGDKVKIKNCGLSYTTYASWIKKNIDDVGLAACFAYSRIPGENDIVYVVKAIAPWGVEHEEDRDKKLAYVQQYFKLSDGEISDNEVCYLMHIDGLERVYE